MVRLHWHVEDGFSAYIPVGGMKLDKATGVYHASCDIELAGQSALIQGVFTLPANYNTDGTISTVGVMLAHGSQADTYKGKLLNHLAVTLAQAGHMVVRYYCAGKEQRRLRLFEKVLDTAATSPFARNITRWVLGGVGSGARVCASVGSRCREQVAGYLLLSYPLLEPVSVFKGPAAPDSTGPLLKLTSPILVLQPANYALGPVEQVVQLAPKLPTWDVRLVAINNVDGHFRDPESHAAPSQEVRQQLAALALQFVDALTNGTLDECDGVLPRIRDPAAPLGPPPAPPNVMRPPLQLPPFHLLVQQHMRMQAGNKAGIQNLPPAAVSLLLMSQQLHQQQQLVLDEAAAKATAAMQAAVAAANGAAALLQGGQPGVQGQLVQGTDGQAGAGDGLGAVVQDPGSVMLSLPAGAQPVQGLLTVLPAGTLQPRTSLQAQDAPVAVPQQAQTQAVPADQQAPDMTLDLSGGQAVLRASSGGGADGGEPDAKRQCVGE